MNVPCRLIEDLLPLYHDEICSQASRELVEEHLQSCPACQASLTRLRENLLHPAPDQEEADALKTVQSAWKRAKRLAFGKGAALVALAMLLVFAVLGAVFTTPCHPVPAEKIQISQVCQLEDGTILFHLYIDDGAVLESLRWDQEADGSVYITPIHALWKTKRPDDKGLCNVYLSCTLLEPGDDGARRRGEFGFPAPTALYVGAPGDGVLVWKAGMTLPKGSPAMEELADHYISVYAYDHRQSIDWDAYYQTYAAILGDEFFRKEATP